VFSLLKGPLKGLEKKEEDIIGNFNTSINIRV
jgi:hypothetical protein